MNMTCLGSKRRAETVLQITEVGVSEQSVKAAAGSGGTERVLRVEERLGSAHMCSVCFWPPGEPHGDGPRSFVLLAWSRRVPLGEFTTRSVRLKSESWCAAAAQEEISEGRGVSPGGRELAVVIKVLLRFDWSAVGCFCCVFLSCEPDIQWGKSSLI